MFENRTGQSSPAGACTKALNESAAAPLDDDGLMRYRIAMLAFDTPEALADAAHDLANSGFSTGQLCIFGPRSTLTPQPEQPDHFAGFDLFPATEVTFTGADPLSVRTGQQVARIFGLTTQSAKSPGWMRPDISASIVRAIGQGRLVLLVAAQSASQHAVGARLLLGHGKYDLQTHEFSVRQGI